MLALGLRGEGDASVSFGLNCEFAVFGVCLFSLDLAYGDTGRLSASEDGINGEVVALCKIRAAVSEEEAAAELHVLEGSSALKRACEETEGRILSDCRKIDRVRDIVEGEILNISILAYRGEQTVSKSSS